MTHLPTTFEVPPSPASGMLRRVEDRQYSQMHQVFVATGGIVTGNQLADLLRRRKAQPISALARWIVAREVVSLSWQGQLMVPLFQFDAETMSVRPCMAPILQELKDVFDDWDLALWFATPNGWTGNVAPAFAIHQESRFVHDAARGDRFLARG